MLFPLLSMIMSLLLMSLLVKSSKRMCRHIQCSLVSNVQCVRKYALAVRSVARSGNNMHMC